MISNSSSLFFVMMISSVFGLQTSAAQKKTKDKTIPASGLPGCSPPPPSTWFRVARDENSPHHQNNDNNKARSQSRIRCRKSSSSFPRRPQRWWVTTWRDGIGRDAPRLLSQLSVPPPRAPAEEGAQTHRAQDGGQEQGQRVPGVVSLHRGDEGEERQQGDRRRVREFNFGSHVDAFGGVLFFFFLPPRCRTSLSGSQASAAASQSDDASSGRTSWCAQPIAAQLYSNLFPLDVFFRSP